MEHLLRAKRAILWCDDEEYILSSVRRLLRNSQYNLVTETNPKRALELLKENFFSIVVSDQRMPEMTGIEFLEQVKALSPYSTRIMVTGFIDSELLSDAVNKASVFRYINKPWDDASLLNDLDQAYVFERRRHKSEVLRKKIQSQNQSLADLNQGLELVVAQRTQSLEESRNELKVQEQKIRALTYFIERLNVAETIEEILATVANEIQSLLGTGVVNFLIPFDGATAVLYSVHNKKISAVKVQDAYCDFHNIRINEEQDQRFLVTQLGRPVSKVLVLPLQHKSSGASKQRAGVFFEFFDEMSKVEQVLGVVVERLQPVGIAIDRILLSEGVNKSARQWEKTFDLIDDPIAILDASYNVLRANKGFRSTRVNKKCFELLADRSEPCIGCPLPEVLEKKKPSFGRININEKIFELQSFPIQFPDAQGLPTIINHYRDITEYQKLYGQLIQSEKAAAMGRLAGNIAHELNNPLTGIQALTQILISKIENDSVKNDLKDIQMASIRSQNIIKNFQKFSSGEESKQREWVSLNEVIEKTLPFLKTATRDLENSVNFSGENPKVLANQSLLQQVVFNLVINAAHAMSGKGRLDITVFSDNSRKGFVVKDTGSGIPEDIQMAIFEPFFTTKKEGVGTGLGLSLCRNIIREFGGDITLTSSVGRGSEFRIEFPVG